MNRRTGVVIAVLAVLSLGVALVYGLPGVALLALVGVLAFGLGIALHLIDLPHVLAEWRAGRED